MPVKNLNKILAWGAILWIIGYALGFIFFAIVPPQYIGWAIMPIATAITIWVLIKKIHGAVWKDHLMASAIWTLIAIIFDYLFIVLLLKSNNYYKLDVYLYYILTFILPPIVGALKNKPQPPTSPTPTSA